MSFSIRIGIDASKQRNTMKSKKYKKWLERSIKLPDNYGEMLKGIANTAMSIASIRNITNDNALIGLSYMMAAGAGKMIENYKEYPWWDKELENPVI